LLPYFGTNVSDPRGALADGALTMGGRAVTLVRGSTYRTRSALSPPLHPA